MVLSPHVNSGAAEGQNNSLDFFSQAIQRYKKSVNESNFEEDDSKPSPQTGLTKKRPLSNVSSDDSAIRNQGKRSKNFSPFDFGSGSGDTDLPDEPETCVEKKRLASRVSSRRTREREKLRMDHFRNAELKLQQENKKLEEENDQIRVLIKKIKEEKQVHERNFLQSMLTKNIASPTQLPLQGPQGRAASAVPFPQHYPSLATQSSSAGMVNLLNALLSGAQASPSPAPLLPNEQQLLSLLSLVSVNPVLLQLLSAHTQIPKNQNDILAAMVQGVNNSFPTAQQQNNSGNFLNENLLSLLLSAGGGGPGQSIGARSNSGYISSMDLARSV